jgi:hypothetical protein
LLTFAVADPADAWVDLGFAVTNGVCRVGEACFALGGVGGRGLRAWSGPAVDGLTECDAAAVVDDLPHPNGVVALDHVVITTPDHERTLAAFADAGYDLRRLRETDSYGAPMRQGFFKEGSVILEVIGPAAPMGDKPARFWGLAWTVASLDDTAEVLGPRLHPSKEAVQPGRRIATLDKAAGSTVAMAFMSPGRAAVA